MKYTFSLTGNNMFLGGAESKGSKALDFIKESAQDLANRWQKPIRATRADNRGGKRGETFTVSPR